jgi:hypothetical protein
LIFNQNMKKIVDKLSVLLKKQFDIQVSITILRILFREEENLGELELQMFQQEIEYTTLAELDEEIVLYQQQLEWLNLELDVL